MSLDKEKIESNENWFYCYVDKIEKAFGQKHKKFDEYYLCPCCRYPTLSERVGWEICTLCFWEDDGQDDHDADEIRGGPNSNYSLTEARLNFRKYFTMYRPSDIDKFETATAKKNYMGKIVLDKVELKKKIIKMYQELIKFTSVDERHELFVEIKRLKKKL